MMASATLAATWHVAPDGDDTMGDGTKEKPVATIARAVALSRGAAKGETNEIVVADGEYAVTNAVFFNAEYNETRYYEGPSKGEKPAGSIVLTTPEVVAQK